MEIGSTKIEAKAVSFALHHRRLTGLPITQLGGYSAAKLCAGVLASGKPCG